MRTKRTYVLMTIAALLVLLWIAGSARAYPPADEPPGQGEVSVASVVSPLLQYQGRLTDPSTGEPVTDGVYSMSFRLYDVESSGSPLWAEIKDVSVQSGLFSTVLGDTTSLDQGLFDGQALWLGIKVGADAEATPRQQVLPVAYALSLVPGAVVEANSSATVLQVNNTGSGEALHIEGPMALDGDLTVSGSLTGGSHNHSGGDITSGTVAEARIDSAIARDSEIMPTVLANDGAGSGLDADLLDGYQGSALFALNENETVNGRPAFYGGTSGSTPPFTVDSTYLVTNLNADLVDGQHASAFAAASHEHDDRYYTESESDSRYVNVTGDTMSGALTAPQINYTTPRTHHFVVGGEDFAPSSNVDYSSSGGCGGAYRSTTGGLVAPVHLPHGAVVTNFEVFFYDTSTGDMEVRLWGQYLSGCGFFTMAQVNSSGTSGYYNLTDTTISSSTINNTANAYHVQAYSTAWDGNNLRIKGALITYTISEAP